MISGVARPTELSEMQTRTILQLCSLLHANACHPCVVCLVLSCIFTFPSLEVIRVGFTEKPV
jgi:hypothetical protein